MLIPSEIATADERVTDQSGSDHVPAFPIALAPALQEKG